MADDQLVFRTTCWVEDLEVRLHGVVDDQEMAALIGQIDLCGPAASQAAIRKADAAIGEAYRKLKEAREALREILKS